VPLQQALVGGIGSTLWLLLGAVGLVLLIGLSLKQKKRRT